MAEPSSLSSSCFSSQRSETQKGFTDPEMAAAQQLMQLSGDEEDNDCKSKNKGNPDGEEEELEQNQSEITSAKIEEIFGREEEEEEEKQLRPRKRRYRSLVHIYMTTEPVNVKKVRC
ncbi:hypothetical protein AAG906_024352 [Vitis piasezkii]|uniref:Uncharacterized protein n=3 Tax=Vitis vinifera TaxID=29760 RepID=A0A438F5J9_VITVI|nr:uncharacterized protein LOC104879929 [Vitis vinifera]RVW55287.1 hypothetical protein CK203_067053 [Vitis vinifera]|eukprot:XP_010652898.1 PREDICTED: uncharacterized protein LOC104879929 [Vitis vinifera]